MILLHFQRPISIFRAHDYLCFTLERATHLQRAIFLDRDGVINEDTDFVTTPEALRLFPHTAKAVRRINESAYKAVVVTNQSAVARGMCTESGLREIHDRLETELARSDARLDAIYYCPHYPDHRINGNPAYLTDCACRKPKPGMLLQAAADLGLSLGDSFLIGDSDRDKEAGKRAGCTTVTVRSGKGGADLKSDPDYLFEDLAEAVDFIVDDPLSRHFDTFWTRYERCSKEHKPFVILIGGQARSGKSTLASYLRLGFQKRGQQVLSVKADDWIMPADDRTGRETVPERFRLKTFERDMLDLFNKEPVTVQKYDSRSRSLREETIYRYSGQDVVILDGTPLLHSQTLLNLADVSVFVGLDEAERHKRFVQFYRWKEFSENETGLLYTERLQDEVPFIAETALKADIIINI